MFCHRQYAVILLIIFILQIALGVFAFLEIKDEKDFQTNVDKTIDQIFRKTDNASMEVRDFIQKELHCCGTYGPLFYAEIREQVPPSCKKDNIIPYTAGCQKTFFVFLKDAARIIGIVVLALAATEVSHWFKWLIKLNIAKLIFL